LNIAFQDLFHTFDNGWLGGGGGAAADDDDWLLLVDTTAVTEPVIYSVYEHEAACTL
jgi:hypothetical protein